MMNLLKLYYLILLLGLWQLQDQKVVEESAIILLPKRCFLHSLLYVFENDTFRNAPTFGAFMAPVTSAQYDRTRDE